MGKKVRGKRTGTGPYAESYQARLGKKGKRKLMGEVCPFDEEKIKPEFRL
jgi:hypothetical protein